MWKQVIVALSAFQAVFFAIIMITGHTPDTITILANLGFSGWLAMEAARVRLGHNKGESRTFGLLSRFFLVSSFTVVAIAFYDRAASYPLLSHLAYPNFATALGVALFTLGVYLRHLSISTLGKFFVTKVQITDDHQLVKVGIYAHLRHPSYTGLITGFIGTVLILQSMVALILFFAVALPAYIYRIRVEEAALVTTFGTDYHDYRSQTYAIIPFVY
jgi:protein-S-isoprenylcysteine O-methyltransferase Ste14